MNMRIFAPIWDEMDTIKMLEREGARERGRRGDDRWC